MKPYEELTPEQRKRMARGFAELLGEIAAAEPQFAIPTPAPEDVPTLDGVGCLVCGARRAFGGSYCRECGKDLYE